MTNRLLIPLGALFALSFVVACDDEAPEPLAAEEVAKVELPAPALPPKAPPKVVEPDRTPPPKKGKEVKRKFKFGKNSKEFKPFRCCKKGKKRRVKLVFQRSKAPELSDGFVLQIVLSRKLYMWDSQEGKEIRPTDPSDSKGFIYSLRWRREKKRSVLVWEDAKKAKKVRIRTLPKGFLAR